MKPYIHAIILALLLAFPRATTAQSYTFEGIPWGTPRASVFQRLQGLGYRFDQDFANGRVTFKAPQTTLYLAFDGARLLSISRSLEIEGAQKIRNNFHRLADSVRVSLGSPDSAYSNDGIDTRVWRKQSRGEALRITANAIEATDSTFPYVAISHEGPGYAEWNARFIANILRELEQERLAWIYERAPQSRWELLNHQSKFAYLYERARAARLPTGTWRAWFRVVYKEPETAENGIRYDVTLEDTEVDCTGRRFRTREFVAYSGIDVVESSAATSVWQRWLPESVGEATYEAFCRSVRDRR